MSCPLPGTGHCAQPGTGQCCVTSHTSTLCCSRGQCGHGDMMGTWWDGGDMNHRQGTCRTGNSGYPGTKEPTLQIVLSLHDCMTAACSLHSADLTAPVSGAAAPGALLRSRWWRSGARCAGSGAQLEWRRACGGRQLTVRGAGETTPAQQQSPTPERSYCYTAVFLWFLMPVAIIET